MLICATEGRGTMRKRKRDCFDDMYEKETKDRYVPSFDDPVYREHLKDFNLTEEQTVEYLRALHLICQTFVDLGWGTDPTQLAMGKVCAEAFNEDEKPKFSPEIERLIEESVRKMEKKGR
jgi:Zn-finger domain-containing protein